MVSPENRVFLKGRFGPLLNPLFRALVIAQFVSFVGTWMQELARSWYVLEQGGQATKMGFLMFALGLPVLLLWPIGGILADRFSVKKILVITQSFLALNAIGTAILFYSGVLEFWHLIVVAVIDGILIVFDAPAFQVYIREILRGEDFQQGLAINSVSFHMSRVVGPSLAGMLMSMLPIAWVFFLNGLSFMVIVWVIRRLPFKEKEHLKMPTGKHSFSPGEIKELFVFIKSHPILLRCFINFWSVMTLILPLIFTTLRVYLKNLLHMDARIFGLVFMAPGLGALVASFFILLLKPKEPFKLTPLGVLIILVGMGLVVHSRDVFLTFIGLFVYSFGLFVFLNSNVISLSLNVADHLRGRLSSLIGVAFAAWAPMMSLLLGIFSDKVGPVRSLEILAATFVAVILLNYSILKNRVRLFSSELLSK
ncbi:MAG: MFS transporter [Proteobacteria bacterium]|nr:MFS transporter [Pseudomonadota bacterium]